MISIAAICAMLFFVACGDSDGTTTAYGANTKADDDGNNNDGGNGGNGNGGNDNGENGNGGNGNGGNDNGGNDNGGNGDGGDTSDSDTNDTADTDTDTGTDTGDTDTDDTDTETCELSEVEQGFLGTWAMKIILRSSSTTGGIGAIAGQVPSVTTRYVVTEIKPDKNCKLDFFKKGNRLCRTDNRTGTSITTYGRVGFNDYDGSKFNTHFYHWKTYEVPGHENEAYLEISEDGKTFKLNKDWELRGAKMNNPETEEMIKPTDNGGKGDNDPRIDDTDKDGNPAFTIMFNSAFANGQMYYIQRLSHIFTGTVVEDGKIKGDVEWTDEQYAHQATSDKNLKAQKETTTDFPGKNVFQLVKVDDSMDCATLLEKADKGEIFDIADPNTDVPHNNYEN